MNEAYTPDQRRATSDERRIGVDTGGTFTDLVLDPGPPHPLFTHKLLSTPHDPSEAVLAGIRALLDRFVEATGLESQVSVVHGSTVATNALLEGKGARVAFVTTAGFEDTLHIARQNRPDLYALSVARPDPPVTLDRCLGVRERLLYDGSVLEPLDDDEIERVLAQLSELEVEAVAVSLLHSYADPGHEQRLAARLREALPGVHLTVSHDVLPEFREYERAATCIANAVVAPPMTRYLNRLGDALGTDRLRIMVSNGGSLPVDAVVRAPVQTALSGPAGGVVGAWKLARTAGFERIITLDMGGTSTDVALCDGKPARTTETEMAGLPIRLPMIDMHTVGAGGGSMAWRDAGGALHVGPQSAGADPGPACYGRQTAPFQATVTDAHVVLGHLPVDQPLGGNLRLKATAAHEAVEHIADTVGLSKLEAARGILRIAEATMARAVQRISVQRGHDPRDFALMPFGGAGGLHACSLAASLGMTQVLVPRYSGVLSALGMLAAASLYTFSRSVLLPFDRIDGRYPDPRQHPVLQAALSALHDQANAALEREGVAVADRRFAPAFDLRYRGQSYELTVPVESDPVEAFIAQHQRLYGYVADKSIEVVTVRLQASGPEPTLRVPPLGPRASDPAPLRVEDYIARMDLCTGDRIDGPFIVTEDTATTLVPEGWTMEVDTVGHLVLTHVGRVQRRSDSTEKRQGQEIQ